jgi:hypothetical protein
MAIKTDYFTDEERLEQLSDPCLWAETNLQDPNKPAQPLRLRWYQKEIINDNIQRRILRMGRRTGKTATLAIIALNKAYTHFNYQILITAAYDSQVQEIFEQMLRMAENSPLLAPGIERTRQRPYEIWLTNGSLIRGMVANNTVRSKCLPSGSIVVCENYEFKKIEEIKPGQKVLSLEMKTLEWKWKPVVEVHENGEQPILEMSTTSGRLLRATPEHKVHVHGRGWAPLEEVKTMHEDSGLGDFVALGTLSGGAKLARVRSLSVVGTAQTWDLEVEDNHNYVAFWPDENLERSPFSMTGLVDGGFLVHNSANVVICDEMDYMDQNALREAVWPVTTTYKTTEVIVSSTPTGRREFFYDISRNKRKYKFHEHHFPSAYSPEWTPEAEAFARDTTTVAQYSHEYLAEFGEAAEGVFKHHLVDKAMYAYSYDDLPYNPKNFYTLGVDWNEAAAGIQCVILEWLTEPEEMYKYDPTEDEISEKPVKVKHMWRMFRAFKLDSQDYTNVSAIDDILGWAKKIKLDYACFDQGHGYTNYELLRLAIQNGRTATGKNVAGLEDLLEHMQAVSFAAPYEIIDPITQMTRKSKTKNVLVRNAVKQFENLNIIIPAVDKDKVPVENNKLALIGQLRDYVVERIGDGGEVYSKGNDHRLDAFMLALHGYLLNKDLLMHWAAATKSEIVPNTISPASMMASLHSAKTKSKYKPSVKSSSTIGGVSVNDLGHHFGTGSPPDSDDLPSSSTTSFRGHTPRAGLGGRRIGR